jgi:hypothetical protein
MWQTVCAITGNESRRRKAICEDLLDEAYQNLTCGRIEEGVDRLVLGLQRLWLESNPEQRKATASACLAHPVRRLLHEDPFTFRAFSKPRGYAGDALLLDYIYGVYDQPSASQAPSPVGRRLFDHHIAYGPSPKAVRARRQILAELVDATDARVERPRILSVAAGHLREAGLSVAVREGRVAEFVALDQDEDSLAVVERCYARFGVRSVRASVRQLLAGKPRLGLFDCAYSAGLYDYLQHKTAQHLTRRMFGMLRPGGRLLVANFLPGIRDVGYMESFMDWRLIYRSAEELRDVAGTIDPAQIAEARFFTEENQNIGFLLLTRK